MFRPVRPPRTRAAPRSRGNEVTSQLRQYRELEKKISRSLELLTLLDRDSYLLENRYLQAVHEDVLAVRYSLRLQLSTLSGFKAMLIEYIDQKANESSRLYRQLRRDLAMLGVESDNQEGDNAEQGENDGEENEVNEILDEADIGEND